jgi:hypothetical protein
MRTLLLLLTGVSIALTTVGNAETQETEREVLLKDQFGHVDGPGRHRGQPVLLIYGKVDGMRRMKAWEDKVRAKVPETVLVLRGLDARNARGQKTEAEVNERLQRVVPSDIAILVDWKGELVQAYRLPDADVSATVLDPTGKPCDTVAGAVTPQGLDHVHQLLERVRTAGTCS